MTHNALFKVVEVTGDSVTIRDRNVPNHKSVTNDVERVVASLSASGILDGARLFYYDTMDNLDEILHDGKGGFVGFAPGPRRENK